MHVIEAAPERTQIVIDSPTSETLVIRTAELIAEAEALVVDSPGMKQIAADLVGTLKSRGKSYDEERKELTRPLDELKSKLIKKYEPALTAIEKTVDLLLRGPNGIQVYDDKVERERKRIEDEQAELRRKADAKAAEEAAKITAAAEKEAERLRNLARDAAAKGNAGKAAQLETRAENTLNEAGEKVDQTISAAAERAPVVQLPETPKATGLSSRETFNAVLDTEKQTPIEAMLQLLKFIVANPAFVNLVKLDEPRVRSQAISMRSAFNVPGLKLIKEKSYASRR